MSGTAFDGPLRILTREKTINQTRGEGIAAANTIENLEVFSICGLIEIAIVVANGSPIISRRGGGFAKCCGDDFEGKVLQDFPDHLFKSFGIECGKMLLGSVHFVAERRRKILFIAKHDIHIGSNTPVYLLRALLPTERSPQRIAIIEIVRGDHAVFSRALQGFDGDLWSRFGKCAEDPAGVKPARAVFAKDGLPIDLTGFERRHRGVAPIRTTKRRSQAEA